MLPNLESKEDAKALSDALEEAFKPVLDEIFETVKNVKQAFPNKKDTDVLVNSVKFSMERLEEAVAEMTKGKTAPKNDEQILTLIEGLKTADAEFRKDIIAEILSNKKMETAILGGFNREMLDQMNEHLVALVGAAEDEKHRAEEEVKERKRKESEDKKNDANRKARGVTAKEPGMISKVAGAIPDIMDDIVKSLKNLGLAFGAFGLFTMLPKQVQEFVGTFITTFTYIRTLLKASWFEPIVKLLEKLPILGTLLKKLPYLNVIMAAFDIIPKIAESFNKDGLWAAMETGLKAVYDFFVGDVLDLVGQFGNWMQEKFLGKVFVDLQGAFGEFGKFAYKYAEDMVSTIKAAFSGDIMGVLKGLGSMLGDTIDAFVNTALAAFSLPADWNTAEKAKQLLDAVANIWESTKQWVTSAVAGIGTFITSSVDYLVTGITNKWNAAVDAIGDFGSMIGGFVDSTMQFVTDMWDTFTGGLSSAWTAAVNAPREVGAYLSGIFDSVSTWLTDSWTAGIGAVTDFTESIGTIVNDIWNAITDKITSIFTDAIASLTELKDSMAAWFDTLVKKVANSILDTLPFGMGDSLKFDVQTPEAAAAPETPAPEPRRPMAQVEERMVSGSIAADAARRPPPPSRGGQSVRIDNSSRSTSTVYSVTSQPQAYAADPLGRR